MTKIFTKVDRESLMTYVDSTEFTLGSSISSVVFGASLPAVGAADTLYLVTITNKLYRWAGGSTGYVELGMHRASYTHTQVAPLGVWTVNHNLGLIPNVVTLDNVGNVVAAEIRHTNITQAVISFNQPFAGSAIFS